MKINLKTFEADGTPAEIIELVMLYEQKHAPRKCPEPNLTVTIEKTPKPVWKPTLPEPDAVKRRIIIDWSRADELKAQGFKYAAIAEKLGCSYAAVAAHYAKKKAEAEGEPGD